MATTTTTTLMNLVLPVPGAAGQVGPTWATNLNTALTLIDSHDHSSGKGQKVTPAGININADLTLAGFNLTTVNSARFSSQSAALSGSSDKIAVYSVLGDLYWNNSSGTAVQITSGGSVAGASGTITGLASPASVTFAGSSPNASFSFIQAAGIAAKMVHGDVAITETVSSGNSVTLKAPTSLASSYSVKLWTAAPASGTKFATLDSTGQLACVYDVDSSTIEVSSNVVRVKDAGITTAKLASDSVTTVKILDANVTTAKIADLNVTTAKLAAGAVTAAKITAGTITGNELISSINLPGADANVVGKHIVTSNYTGGTSMGMIRGRIGSSGTVLAGEGFTVNRDSAGVYAIAYTTVFTDIASIIVESYGALVSHYISSQSASGAQITFDAATDTEFNFIAIGMRA